MRRPGDLILKDPQSEEPEGIDWTDFLDELGTDVQIQVSEWFVTGPDDALVLANETVVTGNLKTQVFLTGGTPKKRYKVTNHIETNSTPTVKDDRSFYVRITNK